MDNIPKFMVSLVLIMLCLIIGVSLIFTNFYIDQARSYHDQVIKVVSGSDFTAAKIQECIAEAQSDGYELSIQQSGDGYVYRVDLTYSISVPIFGTWAEKTITGYAVDYANLAANGGLNLPTLPTPTISLEGDILTISEVLGATSYDIFIDGELFANTPNTSVDLSEYNLSAGTYKITVEAKANGYNHSAPSNAVTYTVKDVVAAPYITISEDVLTITPGSDQTTGYEIYVDGVLHSTTTDTTVNLKNAGVTEENYSLGDHTITVKAIDTEHTTSADSNAIIYYVGHSYASVVTDPTCTEQGYTTHTCSGCGDSYVDTYVEATGHTAGAEATCTTAQTCTVCGVTINKAPGHSFTYEVKDPTCTEQGYKRNICERCGGYGETITAALGHSYNSAVTDPTCTEQGYTTHTCTRCEDSYVDSYTSPMHNEGTTYECLDSLTHRVTTRCEACSFLFSVETENHIDDNADGTCDHCGWNASTTSIAGLYETGTTNLIASWYKLLDEDIVTEDGAVVVGMEDELAGDLYLPNTLTTLPYDAFLDCTELTAVVIPDSVSSIGAYAFESCESLNSVMIPESITEIEPGTFRGCTSLTSITIPDSVTTIGLSAFDDCTNLASITIPDSVTTIEGNVFRNCTKLSAVTFGENSQLASIGSNAFYNCTSLTSIVIPDSVLSIGMYAFSKCVNLQSIAIPSGVTSISEGAFRGCKKLSAVTFGENSQLTSISNYTFYECTSLTSIVIPDSVETVGIQAFYNCSNLATVTFGENSRLTSIEQTAFYNCIGLTSIIIPESVTSIGGSAFTGCSSLTNVYYFGSAEEWNAVAISTSNDALLSANIIYNYTT